MSVYTNIGIHPDSGDFYTKLYPLGEAGPFATVAVKGGSTDIDIFLNTLEDATSLVRAASEAVEFFAELEAAKTEKLTEGGERDGDD